MNLLRVRCGKGQTCSWEGELGQFLAHSTKCPSRVVSCPMKCQSADGQLFQCLLLDLDTHMERDCPYRMSHCPHCYLEGTHKEINDQHLQNCPLVLTTCPSEGCQVEISSSLLLFHLLTDCQFALIECKYNPLGCIVTLPRSEMSLHEGDKEFHLCVLEKSMKAMQQEMQTIQKDISVLKERQMEKASRPALHRVTFKLKQFSRYDPKDSFTFDNIFSDAEKQEYRLRMKVLPKNDGYLSVYFFLMKGPNDDQLSWPFRGEIFVELLNQARDRNHHQMTVEFHRSHGNRVRKDMASSRGFGLQEFMDLVKLRRTIGRRGNKIQYLVDDSLYFRVAIKTFVKKAWLTCTA